MISKLPSILPISQNSQIATTLDAERIGVIDIGSNTVRLVVFDAPARLPVPIFNEGVICGLGRGLGKSGFLNSEGIALAMRALGRFTSLAREMKVKNFISFATAAVRDASDGEKFAKEVELQFGFPVQLLSGKEEARLSAVGILSGFPKADGVSGDLGGGSLDFVSLDKGVFGGSDTLPLGHLRIAEDSGYDVNIAKELIADQFKSISWLGNTSGRTLYAIGGAWRTIARLYIEQTKYPLHVLDNFTIDVSDALSFTDLISGLSYLSLSKMGGVARRRADTLPFAAMVLNKFIGAIQPKQIIFSGYGVREGQFFEMLPAKMKKEDPLISACKGFAIRGGRFSIHGEEIKSWVSPLFSNELQNHNRLSYAASLLSDIGWTEHPDYRAMHSFLRVLRIPISGVTHRQRAMLALTVYLRYNGKLKHLEVQNVRNLLAKKDQNWANIMGMALRLAHLFSGGVPGILSTTGLKLSDSNLKLNVQISSRVLIGDAVERLFYELADILKVKGNIIYS
jgi:exopolyphosphatase/guanosine-5'-triphosphate,3'-diphosphate pyrophosphatase